MPFYSDMYSYGSPTSFSPAHYSAMLYLGSSSSLYSGRLGSPPSSRLPLPSAPRLLPPPVSRRPRRYAPPSLPTISETARSSIISSSPRPLSHYIVPRPIRIDTADIDVTSPRRSDPIPRSPEITVDRKDSPKERVCTIKRGRTVVRLHTRILKERPPSAINATAKTKGERLAEKFYMHQSPSRESPVRAKQNESATQERLEEIMSRERREDCGSKEVKDVSVTKSSAGLPEVKVTDKNAEQFKPLKDEVDNTQRDKETEKTQVKAEGKVKRKIVQGSDDSKQIATKVKIENKLRLIKVEDLEKPQVAIVTAAIQTDVKSESTTGRLGEESKVISESIESAPPKIIKDFSFPVSEGKDKVPRMVVSDVSIEVKHARLPPKLKPAKRLLLQVEVVVEGEKTKEESPTCVPSCPATPKTPIHYFPFHSPADAENDKSTLTKSSATLSASTDSVNGKKSGDTKGKQRRKGDAIEAVVRKNNASSAIVLKNQAKITETSCDTVSEKGEGVKAQEEDARVPEKKGLSHPRNIIPKGTQPLKSEGKAESNSARSAAEVKDVNRIPSRQVSNLTSMENSKDVKCMTAAPSEISVRTLTPAGTDTKNTASTESTEDAISSTAQTIPSCKVTEKSLPKDSNQKVSSQAREIKGKQRDTNQTSEMNAVTPINRSADGVNSKLVISNKPLRVEEATANVTNQELKFSKLQPEKIDNDKGASIPKNIEIKKLKADSLLDEEREKKEISVTLDSTTSLSAKSEVQKRKPEGREGSKTEVPSTIAPLEKAKVDRKDDMKLKEIQSLGKSKEKPDQSLHDKLSMTEAKDKQKKTGDSFTRPEPLNKQAEKPLELASRVAAQVKDQLKEPLTKSTTPDTAKGKLENQSNQTSKPMFGTKSQPKDTKQIPGQQEPPKAKDKPPGVCDKISLAINIPENRVEMSKTLAEMKNSDKKPITSEEKPKNATDASESPTTQSPTTKLGKQSALGVKPPPDTHDWLKFQLHPHAEHSTTPATKKASEKLKLSEDTTKDPKCLPKEPVGKTSKTPGKVTDSPVLGLKNKKDPTKGTPEKQTLKEPENKTPERPVLPVSIQAAVNDKNKNQEDKAKSPESILTKAEIRVPVDVNSNAKVPSKSSPVGQPKLKGQAKTPGTGICPPEEVSEEKMELKSIPKLPKNDYSKSDTSVKVSAVEKSSAKELLDMNLKNDVEVGAKIGGSNISNPILELRDTGACEQLTNTDKLDEPRLEKLGGDSTECRGPSGGAKTEEEVEEETEESSEESSEEEESTTEEETEDELEQQLIKEVIARASKPGTSAAPAKSLPRYRDYNIDDFLFLKVLGKGSFGKVFLASLRREDRFYAIKCLKKQSVIEEDDVECTLIERKVLSLATAHPYLCHLFCTFQTESHLFFVMEYLNGGDLMFHIQRTGRFEQDRARFYAAEIVSGIKFLHKKGIIYRDLKLDNILLDYDGHVRIADFGMCKLQIFLDRTADTFCGTPDYIAPEIIHGYRYNQTVDWWSFGVLLYEMLVGQSPFTGCDEDELFWCICNENPVFPRFLSDEACDILAKLLNKDSDRRMGAHGCHAGDIADQAFFRPIDWWRLERRELEPPFRPALKHSLDLQYFDTSFTYEKAKLTPVNKHSLPPEEQLQFDGFSYTNPNATD